MCLPVLIECYHINYNNIFLFQYKTYHSYEATFLINNADEVLLIKIKLKLYIFTKP